MHNPPPTPPDHLSVAVYVVPQALAGTRTGLWLNLTTPAPELAAAMEATGVDPAATAVVDQLGMGPVMLDEDTPLPELIRLAAVRTCKEYGQ